MLTPSYPPLITIAENIGVEVVEIPLLHVDNSHQIDFNEVRKVLSEDPKIEALVLCNPHNPVGRVWNNAEIERVKELVQARDLYLISDEIHGDLVFSDYSFNSVLKTDKAVEKLIVLSSPAKTFNVAGIKASYIIIRNQKIKTRLAERFKINGLNDLDIFAIETLNGLYGNFEDALLWLKNLINVLEENYHYLEGFFLT